MTTSIRVIASLLAASCLSLTGCGDADSGGSNTHDAATHTHTDGTTHQAHASGGATMTSQAGPVHVGEEDHGHAHDEVSIDPAIIGDMTVELAQGHGAIAAGKEGHLVVKLPYNDQGQTIVRAWIGSEDRTRSYVGKGDYAPSHDDYDIHAMAPDPLPADAMWWIEIEQPDGTVAVGAAIPIR